MVRSSGTVTLDYVMKIKYENYENWQFQGKSWWKSTLLFLHQIAAKLRSFNDLIKYLHL